MWIQRACKWWTLNTEIQSEKNQPTKRQTPDWSLYPKHIHRTIIIYYWLKVKHILKLHDFFLKKLFYCNIMEEHINNSACNNNFFLNTDVNGWKFIISKIQNFLNSNLITCSMPTKYKEFQVKIAHFFKQTKIQSEKLLQSVEFCILRLTFYGKSASKSWNQE